MTLVLDTKQGSSQTTNPIDPSLAHHSHHSHHSLSQPVPIPIPLYVGVALSHVHKNKARFGIYVHDGFWSYDFYQENGTDSDATKMSDKIVSSLREYQKEKQCKLVMAGLVNCESTFLRKIGRRLWFELDIIPCILKASGSSLDEKACSAARKTNLYISPTGISGLCRIEVGYRHEVEVDGNGRLSYCALEDYKPFMKESTWNELISTSERVRKAKLRIVFFNSTPQGGGVAIIRHSTIRIFKLLGIDAHWFVMKPNPEVFEITKKKFHNVLQGVAPPETTFTEQDKFVYERWCESNYSSYWSDEDSPVYQADIIVIDDPQPSGMIRKLKKLNPNALFVYRSHIQIRSDLTKEKGTIQNKVWSYLWENIKHCDVFVSHPVDEFIPEEVHSASLGIKKMPAVTDPCDGLNKKLDDASLHYYQLIFNRTAFDQNQCKVDFARPYFIQIARFDPSKGIPDLIDAYVHFRKSIESSNPDLSTVPQLVITGHGSIDDPEATTIYRKIMCILHTFNEKHGDIVSDIIVVRLGPSDQMLNAILTGATCAFQLSHREGFEVKVSEALLKGIPVIAYASGGIPLQIRDGIDGHVLKTGDIIGVANMMERLFYDKDHLTSLRERAAQDNREWILTPSNILHWNNIMLNKSQYVKKTNTSAETNEF